MNIVDWTNENKSISDLILDPGSNIELDEIWILYKNSWNLTLFNRISCNIYHSTECVCVCACCVYYYLLSVLRVYIWFLLVLRFFFFFSSSRFLFVLKWDWNQFFFIMWLNDCKRILIEYILRGKKYANKAKTFPFNIYVYAMNFVCIIMNRDWVGFFFFLALNRSMCIFFFLILMFTCSMNDFAAIQKNTHIRSLMPNARMYIVPHGFLFSVTPLWKWYCISK